MNVMLLQSDWGSGGHLEGYLKALVPRLPSTTLLVDRPADLVVDPVKGGRRRHRRRQRHLEQIGTRTWLLRPFLPIHDVAGLRSRWMGRGLAKLLCRQVVAATRELSGRASPSLLWVHSPVAAPVVEYFDGLRVVYDVHDDYRLRPDGSEAAHMATADSAICRRADVLVTSSRVIAMRREAESSRLLYRGNGAPDFYGPQLEGTHGNGRLPTVLFVGHLRQVIDGRWFADAARTLSGKCRFETVGHIQSKRLAQRLQDAGVQLHSPVSQAELQAHLHRAAVGILPLKQNPYVAAMNPLKIHEYRRCWIPVVSSLVGSVPVDATGITQCRDLDAFVEAIAAASELDRVPRVDGEEVGQGWADVAERAMEALTWV
jgi:glycosyltransferase involved in cell wall biosynthesis